MLGRYTTGAPARSLRIRTPDRIRTGATALRGQRARPLHNGGLHSERCAGVPGLEPRLTEPESVVLPITPYPTKTQPPVEVLFGLRLPAPAFRPARAAQEEHYRMPGAVPKSNTATCGSVRWVTPWPRSGTAAARPPGGAGDRAGACRPVAAHAARRLQRVRDFQPGAFEAAGRRASRRPAALLPTICQDGRERRKILVAATAGGIGPPYNRPAGQRIATDRVRRDPCTIFSAATKPTSPNGRKATNSQRATPAAVSWLMPPEKPLALATMPASAAPTA